MTHLDAVPLWAAIPAAALIVLGSGLTLLGAIGLVRLRNFYDRLHAPTLGTSWGTAGIVLASALMFTVLETRPVIHELLIGLFMTVTTPVTLMLLGRAALHRDRAEGAADVPPAPLVAPPRTPADAAGAPAAPRPAEAPRPGA